MSQDLRGVRSLKGAGFFALFAFSLLAMSGTAAAEGGQTIQSAPIVGWGGHETGNTANGGAAEFREECEGVDYNRNSFWGLPVTVGDHVTIDWGALILRSTCLTVYPVGTTDFNLQSARPEHSSNQGSNGLQELTFIAPATGILPIDFAATALFSGCTSCVGPYEFTANVQHGLTISFPPFSAVAANGVVYASANLASGAPAPDGTAFALNAKWRTAGLAYESNFPATTVGGSMAFHLALPPESAGHKVTLKVTRPGDGVYASAVSNTVIAQIGAAVLPTPKRRHHRRRHHRRHRHRRHHHR